MQNNVRKNEIGKCSFRTDSVKLTLVLRIDLKSKADAENEASDTWDESGQESVEGKRSDQTAISELNHSSKEYISQISIDNFQFCRSVDSVPEMNVQYRFVSNKFDGLLGMVAKLMNQKFINHFH